MADVVSTKRPLPVLVGSNYEHVMGEAEITQTPEEVTITVKARGKDARILADFVTAEVPIALSFTTVPVRSAHPKEKM